MTSYKIMWQEAQEEIAQLRAAMALSPDEAIRELARTRQIVDLAGIARHMHVERFTPQQWRQREFLPPVDFPEIKEPLWYASSIQEQFAEPTGRLWCPEPTAQHAVACAGLHTHGKARQLN